jgi:hypothetical protein
MLATIERWLDRFAPPARAGAILAGVIFAVVLFLNLAPLGHDAHAYWASDPIHPYNAGRLFQQDSYFYSPAFTQALGPLHGLPWPIFAGFWTLLLVAVLAWIGGPWLGYVLLVPPVFIELAMGNIHILLAAAIIVGFRWPAAWSFVLLTKVTPGVGLIWFLVRREWRSLAIALGATAAIAAVSFAIAPAAWADWIGILRAEQVGEHRAPTPLEYIPLPIRVAVAAGLVAWAARTDRRWVVPIAATLALPVIYINSPALLVAAPYLWTRDRAVRTLSPLPTGEAGNLRRAGAG